MTKRRSIVFKVLTPLLLAAVVQAAVFSGLVFSSGAAEQLRGDSFKAAEQKISEKGRTLQNKMDWQWANIGAAADKIEQQIEADSAGSGTLVSQLPAKPVLSEQVLKELFPSLKYMLEQNDVTGVFIMLGTPDSLSETPAKNTGLYLRNSSNTKGTKVILERSPESFKKLPNCVPSNSWASAFNFNVEERAENFLAKPFEAAQQNPGLSSKQLGYWSVPFRLDAKDETVVTYSVPLIQNGRPYGVLGVEISVASLKSFLFKDAWFPAEQSTSALAFANGEKTRFTAVVQDGDFYNRLFPGKTEIELPASPVYRKFYFLQSPEGSQSAYAFVQPLNLYSEKSPFTEERWVFVSVLQADTFASETGRLKWYAMAAVGASLFITLLGCMIAGIRMRRPLTELNRALRKNSILHPVKLPRFHLLEIDALASSIEWVNRRVADASSKMEEIMKFSNLPIGILSIEKLTGESFCTERFYTLVTCTPEETKTVSSFYEKLSRFDLLPVEDESSAEYLSYLVNLPHDIWVQLRISESGERFLVVATDVTQQEREKQRIKYERDYDVLTALPNRRAFQQQVMGLMNAADYHSVGAFIMMDLDNLKYINDTYGHDFGDTYIRAAADILRKFSGGRSIAGRMSGDEFFMFLYAFSSQEEVRATIAQLKEALETTYVKLPSGKAFYLRLSGGIAWFPEDADTYEKISKYADFAMYQVKSSGKGAFAEFDRARYQKEAYLVHGSEELEKLIEEHSVYYHFQPIADVSTGEVFGYEALMRTEGTAFLKTPQEVLTLARAQRKLYQIERLTFFEGICAFAQAETIPSAVRLFINSISNQMLTEKDLEELELRFPNSLSRLVVEFTEEEPHNAEYTRLKRDCCRKWHCQIALDDFGAGYNGESTLLALSPDYIKVDISIVKDIDSDENRRKLFQNTISYAHSYGIKVIAEGVETQTEMQTLIACGADYLQGFYIAKPSFELTDISKNKKEEIRMAAHGNHV